MSAPLVSVIIPVYNIGSYLNDCIQSLVNQTYTNTELLFVDDGSTDHSPEILKAAESKHPNIRVLHQENAGQGEARNKGLDNATGEYVTFLDGDDWLAPETIEATVNAALKDNADVVCFGFQMVTRQEDGTLKALYAFEYDPAAFTDKDYISACFAENTLDKKVLNTATMGKLYKLSHLNNNSIRFRLRSFEDSPFMIEAVYYADTVTCINGLFYYYNKREQSTTTSVLSEKKITAFYKADKAIKAFLTDKGVLGRYAAAYGRFHNSRLLVYGGYYDVFKRETPASIEDFTLFISQLQKNSKDFGWERKRLYRSYRKRIPALHVGLFFSRISTKMAFNFLNMYERKYGIKNQ